MSVKDRLIEFAKSKGMAITSFEKTIGASNGYINNIHKSIGSDKIDILMAKYPELSIEWLITGRGKMIKGMAKSKTEVQASQEEMTIRIAELENEVNRLKKANFTNKILLNIILAKLEIDPEDLNKIIDIDQLPTKDI